MFALLYVLFSKIFPIISIWEVREGEEIAAREVPVAQVEEAGAD
jgi:hypothetical protein